MSPTRYADRADAGRVLAAELTARGAGGPHTLVLGLPPRGVAVAAPIAAALRAPLDVLVLRRLGLPGQKEVPMGAVAAVGDDVVVVRDEDVLRAVGVPTVAFEAAARRETEEVRRRTALYRGTRRAARVRDKVVILVDDGLAPWKALATAAAAVRRRSPARVVVAVPVAAPEACDQLRAHADEVLCPWTRSRLRCAGDAYEQFAQPSDEQVQAALRTATPVPPPADPLAQAASPLPASVSRAESAPAG